jgi:hypothetical protein
MRKMKKVEKKRPFGRPRHRKHWKGYYKNKIGRCRFESCGSG